MEGEVFRTIQGIKLTNKNYPEALEVLRRRYGNKQRIISAHMNELLNIKKVERDRYLQRLRRLYDDIESHVRSLRSLDVDDDNYGSLLTPIIMERLPHQFKLMISRQVGDDPWDLTQLLCLIRDELKDNSFTRNLQDNYKGGKKFDSTYTGAGLHISRQALKIVCVFCQDKHWSDKCQVVTYPLSRREFLKKSGKCSLYLKDNHQVKNCKKSKPCYYRKGLHNSEICFQNDKKGNSPKLADKIKQDEKIESTENSHGCHVQSDVSFVILHTAAVVVKNPKDSKELKIKVLFDNGSQRSYISNRVANFLNLPSESFENICISTFGNSNQNAIVVTVQLKSKVEESIDMKVLSVPFICMLLKN